MGVQLRHKRSATAGAAPTTADIGPGEIAINVADGTAYTVRQVGESESIVPFGHERLAKSANLSDLADPVAARAAIGAQPLNSVLTALAALGTVPAGRLLYTSDADAWSPAAVTAAGLLLLGSANVAAMRTYLDLEPGVDVAALASPAFTGAPTAPTPAAGTNTGQLATTAFVQAALADLIGSAPGALDTLAELAEALGDDPNFAATITSALAGKQPLNAALTSIAGLTFAAGKILYATGGSTFDTTDLSAFMRSLLGAANGAAVLAAIGAAASSHTHNASDITGGTLPANRGGTGLSSYTAGNFLRASGTTTLAQRTPAQVLADIGAAASAHGHSAGDITSGILAAARGGTGLGSYTTGSYLRAASSSALELRTAAQVLGDIGAAPLASPALTGTPTAPTASAGSNTAQIATTAYVRGEVSALVASAPGVLDTLGELATALGNDPNFATSVAAALAGKQPLDGTLTAIAAVSFSTDKLLYATGADAFALADLTAFARSILDDPDAATVRATIGAETLGELSGINTRTASYTLALSDKGKTVEMNLAGANTLTVPPNSSVAFPVGSYINVVQIGAGLTTIVAGSGVTIRSRNGLKMGGQYAMATLYKRGTNEWVLGGDVSA